MTEPAVGASVCASGSQVWKGHMGTLMAKARKKPRKAHSCSVGSKSKAQQLLVVEGALPGAGGLLVAPGHGQDGHQHEQRADERVDDELDRRVDAVGAAPDADDEVHRHEDDFPEDVEEEEVEGQEDAQHAHLEDEEGDHVLLHARLDGAEAGQDADRASGAS